MQSAPYLPPWIDQSGADLPNLEGDPRQGRQSIREVIKTDSNGPNGSFRKHVHLLL